MLVRLGLAALCVGLAVSPAFAQATAASAPAPVVTGTTTDPPATLVYANRTIVTFRARMFSRPPDERVTAAVQVLDRLVDETPHARVTAQPSGDAVIIHVGERGVFTILPGDVDTLAGATVAATAAEAASRLGRAFGEAVEVHNPRRLLRAGLLALGATILYLGLLLGLRRVHRAAIEPNDGAAYSETGRRRRKRPRLAGPGIPPARRHARVARGGAAADLRLGDVRAPALSAYASGR